MLSTNASGQSELQSCRVSMCPFSCRIPDERATDLGLSMAQSEAQRVVFPHISREPDRGQAGPWIFAIPIRTLMTSDLTMDANLHLPCCSLWTMNVPYVQQLRRVSRRNAVNKPLQNQLLTPESPFPDFWPAHPPVSTLDHLRQRCFHSPSQDSISCSCPSDNAPNSFAYPLDQGIVRV